MIIVSATKKRRDKGTTKIVQSTAIITSSARLPSWFQRILLIKEETRTTLLISDTVSATSEPDMDGILAGLLAEWVKEKKRKEKGGKVSDKQSYMGLFTSRITASTFTRARAKRLFIIATSYLADVSS